MFIPLKDKNPTQTFPYVTIALIVLNIWVFVLQFPLGNERVMVNVLYRFAFIPGLFVNQLDEAEYARSWEKLKWEFVRRPAKSRGFFERIRESRKRQVLLGDLEEIKEGRRRLEPLTLLTCLFLHGSLWHVLGNMLFLWVFGNNIEDASGHLKFLLFYLLCGALSCLAHMGANASSIIPTVGASGAISGVMGAYLVLYPTARVVTLIPIFYFLWPVEVPAYLYLVFWFGIQMLLGLPSLNMPGLGGTAWFAHIGGFFAGFVLIYLFKKKHIRSGLRISKE
ncbi:rhomboid family intramembrane serine protease [bacterium]|nr:rhomboid family intramembrane serine protease [bacterium]